jgi:hypothetical protein
VPKPGFKHAIVDLAPDPRVHPVPTRFVLEVLANISTAIFKLLIASAFSLIVFPFAFVNFVFAHHYAQNIPLPKIVYNSLIKRRFVGALRVPWLLGEQLKLKKAGLCALGFTLH